MATPPDKTPELQRRGGAVIRSEGARLLAEILDLPGSTLLAIATTVGCGSPSTIHQYISGKRTPTLDIRARLYEAYGIPARAWSTLPAGAPRGALPPVEPMADVAGAAALAVDPPAESHAHELPQPSAAAPLPPSPLPALSPSAGHPSSLDDCLALLAIVRQQRARPELLPSEIVKLADSETKILALRLRLEQAAEFAEARYVMQHPAWLRLRKLILQALEPHPLATQAVIEAITRAERKR